ncbi:MAG: hypothetical protein ACJATE_000114 [Bacteroidia bacterium]|jgi:hypothetical protein
MFQFIFLHQFLVALRDTDQKGVAEKQVVRLIIILGCMERASFLI